MKKMKWLIRTLVAAVFLLLATTASINAYAESASAQPETLTEGGWVDTNPQPEVKAYSQSDATTFSRSTKCFFGTGTIKVIKLAYRTCQPLANAEFTIYNAYGQKVKTIVTNARGEATLSGLPLGNYKIVETKAPAGYKLDSTPKRFSLCYPFQTLCLKKYNEKEPEDPKGKLEVNKVDENGQPLAGATFEVRNEAGEVVATVTTDATGKATLANLAFGTYTVVETAAPAGYVLDSTPHTVRVTNGVASVTVTNVREAPTLGSLKIIKYVQDSSPVVYLPNAVFEVYDQDMNQIGTNYTTDANGEILLNDLEPGTYYVSEVTPPPGYDADMTLYSVTVVAGQTAEIRHPNVTTQRRGSLTIKKYANDMVGLPTTIPLADAVFIITDASGNVQEVTTDANGQAVVPNLPIGTCTITEKTSPPNYVISDTPEQTVTIVEEQNQDVVFYNNPLAGRLLVFISGITEANLAQVPEFTITRISTNERCTVRANRFGQISIYLPVGDYTMAPSTARLASSHSAKTIKIEGNKVTVVNLSLEAIIGGLN